MMPNRSDTTWRRNAVIFAVLAILAITVSLYAILIGRWSTTQIRITNPFCADWQITTGVGLDFQSTRMVIGGAAHIDDHSAWIVGASFDNAQKLHPLFLRWDGSDITTAPYENFPHNEAELNDVVSTGPDDAYAVGYYMLNGLTYSLIYHWDGTIWKPILMPNVADSSAAPTLYNNRPLPIVSGSNNTLRSVSASSPDDIWAVGTYRDPASKAALILHWDGSSWKLIPPPEPTNGSTSLISVSALGSDDVWIVGTQNSLVNKEPPILTLHWNGSNWTHSTDQFDSPNYTYLNALGASSPANAWLVGDGASMLIRRWADNRWQTPPYPDLSAYAYAHFESVTPVSDRNVWISGSTQVGSIDWQSLVLRWNGTSWSQVPIPYSSDQNYLHRATILSSKTILFAGMTFDGEDGPGTLLLAQLTLCDN